MRSTKVILATALAIIILETIFFSLVTANENYTDQYILKPEAKEELVAFVNEAKDSVLAEGRDKALQVFNDPNGKFSRGDQVDHYIVAYDFNGNLLASSNRPDLIGQNRLNDTDSNGIALIRNSRNLANRGGGFTYAVWPNPIHSSALELMLSYVVKVDDGLWLASGVYLPGKAPIFSNESRKDLVSFAENARNFALNHTKEEALKVFNDKNGQFVKGNRYIFASDFEGNTLALPFDPKAVGTNRIDKPELNGVYGIREGIDVAKRGKGFFYSTVADPTANMTYKLKLTYLTKVNDEWFLGSGIFWPEA